MAKRRAVKSKASGKRTVRRAKPATRSKGGKSKASSAMMKEAKKVMRAVVIGAAAGAAVGALKGAVDAAGERVRFNPEELQPQQSRQALTAGRSNSRVSKARGGARR